MQNAWSWRLPSILQLIPSVFQMALIWFVPESPRWLISQNRNTQALQTLAYYHADSNEFVMSLTKWFPCWLMFRDDPLVRFEFDQIKTAIDREVAAKIGCWKTFFATPTSLKRVNLLLILAFASPWYSYSFVKVLNTAGITNPDIHLLLNGIFQIWNFFWTLLAASLVDRVGRRTLFLTSMGGVIVFFSVLTACSTYYTQTHHRAAAYAFLTSIFLFYGFSNLAFPTLLISYSIEIFPYSLRAKGFTIYNLCACLASFFSLNVSLPIGLGKLRFKSTTALTQQLISRHRSFSVEYYLHSPAYHPSSLLLDLYVTTSGFIMYSLIDYCTCTSCCWDQEPYAGGNWDRLWRQWGYLNPK